VPEHRHLIDVPANTRLRSQFHQGPKRGFETLVYSIVTPTKRGVQRKTLAWVSAGTKMSFHPVVKRMGEFITVLLNVKVLLVRNRVIVYLFSHRRRLIAINK
jgi:hypothetical protein